MTAFESYFAALKRALEQNDVYGIWPDFEPRYDEREYAWAELRGLGESLLLNCGQCDGPSDMRHERCKACVDGREEIARMTYRRTVGRSIEKWPTVILCRIHTE